jgi:uncharacterized protein (DUF983 family)
MSQKPSLLGSILSMKCPNCRKGQMFNNKSIFPLRQLLDMPERCAECGQKMELEIGFYYGTGYVSYGLSVALAVFNLVWYAVIFGISWRDNSMFWYLGITIVTLILFQPWLMRLSRVLYLYMFVRYGRGSIKDNL